VQPLRIAIQRATGFFGPEHEYRTATIAATIFGILYAMLEYYYILERRPGLPFSRAYEPIFFGFYSYHIIPMLPIFALVSFGPFLDDVLFKLRSDPSHREIRRTLLLGLSNTWMAVWIEDVFWFVFRAWSPLRESCLAGKWIQAFMRCQPLESSVFADRIVLPRPDWILVEGPEWTARWGFVSLGPNAIPVWYMVTVAILAAAYYFVFYFGKTSRIA
jgi:hypothetical protein